MRNTEAVSVPTTALAVGMVMAEGGTIVGFGGLRKTRRGTYRAVKVTLLTGGTYIRLYNNAGTQKVSKV